MDHIAPTEPGADGEHTPTAPAPSFLAGLTQAMRAAASHERDRIVALVSATAQEHVEKAHARAALEAAELRRLADEDIHGIDLWASREIKRIRREAAQRSKERRADLASYLERHESIIATEVAGVEAAVGDYTAELDRFVTELVESDDPAGIARQADAVPTPPDFDAVRARSRLDAVAAFEEADIDVVAASMPAVADAGVTVMDSEAEGRAIDLPAADVDTAPADEAAVDAGPSDDAATDDLPIDDAASAVAPPDDVPADDATADQPTGAMRLIRALNPFAAAGETQRTDETEAPQG